jgi:hypothetical protein
MDEWRARMEQRRVAMQSERAVQFEAQKAERAKLADDKAEKRRRAEDANAATGATTSKDEL